MANRDTPGRDKGGPGLPTESLDQQEHGFAATGSGVEALTENESDQLRQVELSEQRLRRYNAELEVALREIETINSALRESEAKFRAVVSQSLVGIAIIEKGKFTYANHKFEQIFGYDAGEILGRQATSLTDERDRAFVADNLQQRLSGELVETVYTCRGLRKDGTVIDIEVHGGAMEVAGKRSLVSMLLDITERVRAEREVLELQERLREQSVRDPLTGLFNRRYLEETLLRELILAKRNNQPVSLIMADLDHFKLINDQYGHLTGDEVLRMFGDMLIRHVRGSDIYCRYGGEEFLAVLPQMSKEKATERAGQLRAALAAYVVNFAGAQIAVTASFGVASFPADGSTVDRLIEAADKAMYAAKTSGRNRVCVAGR